MHYSLKQSLLAGASALVLGMGAAGAAWAGDADAEINTHPNFFENNTAVDNGSVRNNLIDNANNNGAGIVHEQQNNGSNNAISAATASTGDIAGSNAPLGTNAVTNASTDHNYTEHHSYVPQAGAAEQPDRTNEIVGSFNGFDGIATVQQNNGDNNQIGAATANYGSAVSLDDVDQNALANTQTFDQTGDGVDDALVDDETVRGNLIDPTFNTSAGIATVQQNNGNANAIAAATSVVGIAGNAGAVTQDAFANADSDDNNVADEGGERSNEILNSFVHADGVITVQQNNGDANAMSAATAVFGAEGDADSLSQTALAEDNNLNGIEATAENGAAAVDRSNLIDPSFNGADGTVTVQQNNGSVNQIAAATAMAGVAGNVTGDVDQDAEATFNDVGDDEPVTVVDEGQTRENGILNSFNNAKGVITVQQNNGDGNTINAATAVAAVKGSVGGDLTQNVESDDAEIDLSADVDATDGGSTRSNTIDPSFVNAAGTVTVQQNNGSANAMQASTAVAHAASVGGNVVQNETDAEENAVERPHTVDNGSARGNVISDGSFNNAAGTVTVQQNNGDANTMNASTAVVAVTGAVGGDLTQDADAEENSVDYSGVAISASTRNNAIDNSFNNADGTVTVQQNNGNANSMNAATAVAAAGSVAGNVSQGDSLDADSNDIEDSYISDNGSTRGNDVTNAFNNVGGTTIVQQNNGTGNSVNAATAVLTTGVVGGNLSQDVDLNNNEVDGVEVSSVNTWRENNIDPSFTNADGIHSVQQNNGDANSMNVGVAVAYAEDVDGDVTQTVDAADATIVDVEAYDDTSVRHNLIDNSFDGADGVITVQQNNGSANVLNAGSAVLAAGVVEGVDQLEDISQTVNSGGTVLYSDDEDVDDHRSDRNNAIMGSFERANGIVTVQQNNGDSNVLSAATAVADLTGQFADFDDNLTQTVEAGGVVQEVDADDDDHPTNPVDTRGDGGRYNVMNPSFTNSAGVATVQQNNGSNNVMASSTGVMVSEAEEDSSDGTVEHVVQAAEAGGSVLGSEGTHDSLGGHPPPYDRNNDLVSSFTSFDGIATVQQNNGDNNVMASATAVAANFGNPVADDLDDVTSDASTNGVVQDNDADDTASNRENTVGGSFNAASGIVTVQQNNGNNNAVAAATTVAANFDTATPHADTSGEATGSAEVHGNFAAASDLVDRTNAVTGSFGGFKGLANVQQNNGANNVMGAATTVSASNAGASGFGPAVSLASLGASVTGNTAIVAATNGVDPGYSNLVSGSFNNAAGVITVQQNTGSNNAIQSAISVTANFN